MKHSKKLQSKIRKFRILKIKRFLNIFRKGFEQSQIDALLHQFEISIKHQDENFGLRVILVCTND